MKTKVSLRACLVVLASTAVLTTFAQDSDSDGIPDSMEAQLLSGLAPVWHSPHPGHRAPLPLDWAVRRCRVHWHASDDKAAPRIGDTGNTPLTLPLVLDQMQTHRRSGLNYHYRLQFKESDFQHGGDPTDPIRWDRGARVYGRVSPLAGPATHYLVQFFAYFGWNETDTPPGCDAGNHEGDWQCIELHVEASDLSQPRIYYAVLHNHGRQIFVESPAAFRFQGTHPEVFLENETQELWPYIGEQGFLAGTVPPCVSVNRTFGDVENDATAFGGYSVVRDHEGHGGAFLLPVVNVGERGQPYPSDEARFFQGFDGWYGSSWSDECWFWDIVDTSPPSGPAFQSKMWDRAYSHDRVWPSWENQANVFVNFGATREESGSSAQPFNKLSEALAVVAPGGTITLAPGSSGERPTIFENCIITASGGTATIGQ